MLRNVLILSTTALTLGSCVIFQKPKFEIIDDQSVEIRATLGKKFHKRFLKFSEQNPKIKELYLMEIPGSINDEWNTKTCVYIHKNGMNTHLKSNSMIASGGVDLFISGNKRTIEEGAKIGVHSWRDLKKDGSDYPRDAEEHQLFIDFFEVIDFDTSFYWYTLEAAPGNDIHWMSNEEINKYQLRED